MARQAASVGVNDCVDDGGRLRYIGCCVGGLAAALGQGDPRVPDRQRARLVAAEHLGLPVLRVPRHGKRLHRHPLHAAADVAAVEPVAALVGHLARVEERVGEPVV